ncbi:MAG: N-acetylmuramoyl-L-alanine amidase [Proteobacteria bacterium]|nr:N-acetylmuramoyl-L-alanine amidase [Pseudomonadota bacterium]
MIERPSPNFGPRPKDAVIDMLVVHYTGMPSAEEALARLCDPGSQVSAHYVIDEDGTTYRLVGEEERAWHAGEASWAGMRNINDVSIGIELVNPGHEFGYLPFTQVQMDVFTDLAKGVIGRHPIPPSRVLGHSDVAPGRKTDPGELFDWRGAAGAGIGLWPEVPGAADDGEILFAPGEKDPVIVEIQRQLAAFGYGVGSDGILDNPTREVVAAFQRHFRPEKIDGAIDRATVRRLEALSRLGA